VAKPMTEEEQARRQKKTRSVRKLAEQISSLRNRVTRDLKSDDERTKLTAFAVALMDKTAERVGNDESAENGHFGVTGWRSKHVTIDGDKVTLKYMGKSGVDHDKSFTDKTLAGIMKECKERCKGKEDCILVGGDGFRIKADKINRYLSDFGVTAKDIRGYAANSLAVNMLKGSKLSPDEKERKKRFKEVMKSVAEKVGHQLATLKKHYLLPGIERDYVVDGRIPTVKEASVSGFFSRKIALAVVAERLVEENAQKAEKARSTAHEMLPSVLAAYERVTGGMPAELRPLTVAVNDWDLPDGKIGSLKFRDDGTDLMTISPRAYDDEGAPYWWVVIHELVHHVLGNDVGFEHEEEFQRMAEELGIPVDYRD